jgi:hypothetical protein
MADTTDLLKQFRQIVREEIEAEAQTTRRAIDDLSAKQDGHFYTLLDRVKTVEISTRNLTKAQQRVETVQQEHGKKLDAQGQAITEIRATQEAHTKKLDHLASGQTHIETALHVVDEKIEATKAEVDQLLHRPRKAD